MKEQIKDLFGLSEPPEEWDIGEKVNRAQQRIGLLQLGLTAIPATGIVAALLTGDAAQQEIATNLAAGGIGAALALGYAQRQINGLLNNSEDDGVSAEPDFDSVDSKL